MADLRCKTPLSGVRYRVTQRRKSSKPGVAVAVAVLPVVVVVRATPIRA